MNLYLKSHIGGSMQGKAEYYQQLKQFSHFHTHFAFLDTEDYLADGLFIKHQVRVYFGDEFVSPGTPYRIIFCHVRKRDEKRFHAAMRELPNKMLLCGMCIELRPPVCQSKLRVIYSNTSDCDNPSPIFLAHLIYLFPNRRIEFPRRNRPLVCPP